MRLYDGCPDDELAAVWKSREEARKALQKCADKNGFGRAWCTYFPIEGEYSSSMYDENDRYVPLTDFHSSVEASCAAAIERIKEIRNEIHFPNHNRMDSGNLLSCPSLRLGDYYEQYIME